MQLISCASPRWYTAELKLISRRKSDPSIARNSLAGWLEKSYPAAAARRPQEASHLPWPPQPQLQKLRISLCVHTFGTTSIAPIGHGAGVSQHPRPENNTTDGDFLCISAAGDCDTLRSSIYPYGGMLNSQQHFIIMSSRHGRGLTRSGALGLMCA